MTANLSGIQASSLPENSVLSGEDLLMVSEPIGKPQQNQWYSKSVSFSQLSSQLISDIKAVLRFGSMAYEQSADWAPVSHDYIHSGVYNAISVQPYYTEGLSTI